MTLKTVSRTGPGDRASRRANEQKHSRSFPALWYVARCHSVSEKSGARNGGYKVKALLMLENGMTFEGQGFGEPRDVLCEVVFNSAMCGYTELLTDPSYAGQGVVMTYPMIGNYGICYEDAESDRPWVEAFILHSVSGIASNFRCDIDLDGYLKNNHIPGISGVDTRALTRCLRDSGTMRGMICFGDSINREEMKRKIAEYSAIGEVSLVSTKQPRDYGNGSVKVALIDYGTKHNIVRSLTRRGCTVRCFPNHTPFEEIKAWNPDGVMLSNGPGDPKNCMNEVREVKKLYDSGIPTFAICMGHQLLALSQGADTFKLKYGHRGINHPVKELKTNRVYITSQNHGYVVDAKTVDPSIAELSFVSMNDQSVEGLDYKNGRAFSVQFHPEAASGPLDTGFLFDRFMELMGGSRI